MKHIRAILERHRAELPRLMASAAVGGISKAAMLPLVHWAIGSAGTVALVIGGLATLAVVAVGHVLQRRSARALTRMACDEILRRTERMTDLLRSAELRTVEANGAALEQVTRDLERLEVLPQQLRSKLPAVPEMLGHGLYALSISAPACLMWAGGTLLLNRALQRTRSAKLAGLRRADGSWARFDEALGAFLGTFPRLRLDRRGMETAIGEMVQARGAVGDALADVDLILRRSRVQSTVLPILFIGALIYLVQAVVSLDPTRALQLGTIILVARGPMSSLMATDPLLEAERALESLTALEAELLAGGGGLPAPSESPPPFARISLEGMRYGFPGGFTLGPLDLEIRRGELILVVGHNGSGKTTLMKLLCGLYPPDRGRIRIDGRPIAAPALRRLFTLTLIDAHLFDRAYGLGVSDEVIHAALTRLGIDDAVSVQDGHFSTGGLSSARLSSGQGRRLALAMAQLERRPILIMDEWDAHQDPLTTRDYFERILPGLVAEGRTVIAVCHDERYFGVADRVIALADGQLVEHRGALPR